MNIPTERLIEVGSLVYAFAFTGWSVYIRSEKNRLTMGLEALRADHVREVEDNGKRWLDAAKYLVTKSEVETHFRDLEQKVEALNALLVMMIRNNTKGG